MKECGRGWVAVRGLGEVEKRMFVVRFFLFRAEDGIQDLVRSRGLGDVYERRRKDRLYGAVVAFETSTPTPVGVVPASYTHLTLPTISSV